MSSTEGGSSPNSDEKSERHADISPENIQRITTLARQLTDNSLHATLHPADTNPFHGSNDPKLDPRSPSFNAKYWAETVIRLMSDDAERYLPRKAGVSFRNLSVHGFGSPLSYQKDFLNVLLQVSDIASGWFNRKDQKIQILKDHNGLLRSGEMLLVLGRPGR
jgi:ATP-binding cassette subfamily G (WHITE) protein 2 (PDR)